MSKLLRHLRIALIALCGGVALLLCVLWMKSHWSATAVYCNLSEQKSFSLSVDSGRMYFLFRKFRNYIPPDFKSPRVGFSFHQAPRTNTDVDDSSFVFTNNWGITELVLPAWLLVLLPALLAAALTPIYRFSLRSLLIATTVVGVILGIIVWLSRANQLTGRN